MLHVKLKQVKSDGIASTDDSKQTRGGTVFQSHIAWTTAVLKSQMHKHA